MILKPTRRQFLAGSAAALAAGPVRAAADPAVLRAAPAEVQLVPAEYGPTAVWAYDGKVPGEGLRLRQGDRLTRRFVNGLAQDSAVHWHGVRLPNAMDGVPGLTQAPVPPGGAFLYDFAVEDAGTFWLHPHLHTLEQLGRGLFAPLVVEEREAPEVDDDLTLMINDWRLGEDAQILDDFGALHDMAHNGRIGGYLTVNGTPELRHPVRPNQRLRLRLVNAATDRVLLLAVQGLEGWVMALDGMPLAAPLPLEEVRLGPAQRADVIVDVTAGTGAEAYLASVERDGAYALAVLPVEGTGNARRPAPDALPPNRLETPDLDGARRLELRMEGGAMGGMMQARVDGELLPMDALVERGVVWALNGVANRPETPMAEAARGESLRIEMINDTAWPHAMHLHGHHFHAVAPDGSLGPARDTMLVDRAQRVEIALVADNPGDWAFHCHMISHQMSGMTTWLRVG
jgi:FtsP/CotA-like multicopper oxidase with cupredoxin domain